MFSIPGSEFTPVPSAYVEKWITLVRERGVVIDPVVDRLGLDRNALREGRGHVRLADAVVLVLEGLRAGDDGTLGFELGLSLKATSHGLLGYALLSCGTLREAIELGSRFIRLRISPVAVRLRTEGDVAVLQFDENVDLGPARAVVVGAVTGAVVRIGELLVGGPLPRDVVEVWLALPEPPGFERVQARIPPVRFGMPSHVARFPAAWLDRPLDLGEPHTLRELVETLERELSVFGDDSTVAQVRALLERSPKPPDLEAAAKRLGLSSRTLRRRLHQAGITYLDLVNEARTARATDQLLGSSRTVEEVAYELGYADAASFVRAFTKWTGRTPAAFRREHAEKAKGQAPCDDDR